MIEDPPDYHVGYRKPPLHSRFKKGRSGNPEGGRRHRRHDKGLVVLIEEALDRRVADAPRRSRGRPTRREAIVAGLVEKCAAGDLRAFKLLLDLVPKTKLVYDPVSDAEAQTARQRLIQELDRLAAEQAAEAATRDESVCGD